MDVLEAIKSRHSVRSFEAREVEDSKIQQILEAARVSPSAMNRQPWKFIVVQGEKGRNAVLEAQMFFNSWMKPAPVFIVLLADMEAARRPPSSREFSYAFDCGMAAENMLLAAVGLGLGACPVAGFDEKKLSKALGLEKRYKPLLIVPVGYPKGESLSGKLIKGLVHGRRKLEELLLPEPAD